MKIYGASEIINRFSGAVVVENLPAGFTNSNGTITISTALALNAPGYYVVVGKNVVLSTSASQFILGTHGVHISFYNCTVRIDNGTACPFGLTGWGSYSAGDGSAGVQVAGVSGNQSLGRTINFYGCQISENVNGRHNYFVTDFWDCIWMQSHSGGAPFVYVRDGGRVRNSSLVQNGAYGTGGNGGPNFQPMSGNGSFANLELSEFSIQNAGLLNWGQGNLLRLDSYNSSNSAGVYRHGDGGGSSYTPNILTVNPVRKIAAPSDVSYDQATSASVIAAKCVEACGVKFLFSTNAAGTEPVSGIVAFVDAGYSFSNASLLHTIGAGASKMVYTTGVSGRFALTSGTEPSGSAHPVVITRVAQLNKALVDYTSTVKFRSYTHLIDGQFERDVTITTASDYQTYNGTVQVVTADANVITEAQAVTLSGFVSITSTTITVAYGVGSPSTWSNAQMWSAIKKKLHTTSNTSRFDYSGIYNDGETINLGSKSIVIDGPITFTSSLKTTGTVMLSNGSAVTGALEDANGVRVTVRKAGGGAFNIAAKKGASGNYTDLGFQADVSTVTYTVTKGTPVEVVMWSLGCVTYTRTISTINGGVVLEAEMTVNSAINTALDVSNYLPNISLSLDTSGATPFFVITFNSSMTVSGIELGKALVHRLVGQETALRSGFPPGSASTIVINADEITNQLPAVRLDVGPSVPVGGRVYLDFFINTLAAQAINSAYAINPPRADGNQIRILRVKPALDPSQLSASVWTASQRTLTSSSAAARPSIEI